MRCVISTYRRPEKVALAGLLSLLEVSALLFHCSTVNVGSKKSPCLGILIVHRFSTIYDDVRVAEKTFLNRAKHRATGLLVLRLELEIPRQRDPVALDLRHGVSDTRGKNQVGESSVPHDRVLWNDVSFQSIPELLPTDGSLIVTSLNGSLPMKQNGCP